MSFTYIKISCSGRYLDGRRVTCLKGTLGALFKLIKYIFWHFKQYKLCIFIDLTITFASHSKVNLKDGLKIAEHWCSTFFELSV